MKAKLAAFAAAGAAALVAPGVSHAFSCAYNSSTKTISIGLMGNFDGAAIQASSSSDSIFVNGAACGAAKLSNTRNVDVSGDAGSNQELLLELNSPFTNSGGDIDFDVDLGGGTNDDLRILNQTQDAQDVWVYGSLGINLNPAEIVKDADVVVGPGTDLFVAQGDTGNDTISGAGSAGTGAPFARPLTISGGDGADKVTGGSMVDSITGEAGDDVLNGLPGADSLDGGGGLNRGSYAGAPGAVTVNLVAGTASGAYGADTLANLDDLVGTNFGDKLIGNAVANKLNGADGADVIYGRQGNDTITGGPGIDTASYWDAPSAVNVNLSTGTSSGGGGADSLLTVENARGSSFNDVLTGDVNANTIEGGAGNDTIDGQGGLDTVSYGGAAAGVTVHLSTGTGSSSGGAGADILKSIERAAGSAFDDLIVGSSVRDVIGGGGGADNLQGRDGNDTIGGGAGNDKLFGEAGNDSLDGGAGSDTCSQGLGTGTIVNCP